MIEANVEDIEAQFLTPRAVGMIFNTCAQTQSHSHTDRCVHQEQTQRGMPWPKTNQK